MWTYSIFPGLLFLGCLITTCRADEWGRLKTDIFTNYDPGVRPRCGADIPTNVTLGVSLRQVLRLDAPSQEISANVWMRLKWNDCRLAWNETEYDLSHIQVPKDRIWIPDITIYDASTGEVLPGIADYRAKIHSNGLILYNWPTVLRSFCKLKVRHFPMDKQVCAFMFTSWTYHGGEIDWSPMFKTGDISHFQENAEWNVLKYVSERHSLYYSCCPEPYVDLTFYLHLQHRPLHYLISLAFPCGLISAVSLLGFMMPVESGEKVSLQVTVMLSLSVFLLVISEHLPPSSDSMPLLGIYFACMLVMVTVSCSVTVIVLHVHFKTKTRVPRWARTYLIGKLGKLVGAQRKYESQREDALQFSSVQPENTLFMTNNNTDEPVNNQVPKCDEQIVLLREILNHLVAGSRNGTTTQTSQKINGLAASNASKVNNIVEQQNLDMGQRMAEHASYLRRMATHFDLKDKHNKLRNEWRTLAIVIDRLFFVICLTFLVSTTVVIFVEIEN